MRIRLSIITGLYVIFLISCGPSGKLSYTNTQDPIDIALTDFSQKTRFAKIDSVFLISLHGLDQHPDLKIIRIGKTPGKLLFSSQATIGSVGYLPSRFVEKEGKLYYWCDNKFPLTLEALEVFRKFNLLQDDNGGKIKTPQFYRKDERQRAAHYYFCQSDNLNFKLVFTNLGIGTYEPPKLMCK